MSTRESNERRNLVAVNLSLAANLVLAVPSRTGVGILGHSPAYLADGINSTSDVVYLSMVPAVDAMAEAPDREHPFGHHQLETVAALVIGDFVLSTGVAVFWNAIREVFDLFTERESSSGAEAIAVSGRLDTMVLKGGVVLRRPHRPADRQHRRAGPYPRPPQRHPLDCLAAVGICFGRSGFPGSIRPPAAIVAVVIFNTGLKILRDSSSDLMDILPDDRVIEEIRSILGAVPGHGAGSRRSTSTASDCT